MILASFVASFAKEDDGAACLSYTPEQATEDQMEKKTFIESINSQAESPDFCLIQGNSVLGFNLPLSVTPQVLGVITGEAEPEESTADNKEIVEYEVGQGDSMGSIAESFGISLNSLLWANDLTKSSSIKPGQILVVPPVSGIIYYVKSGDTISEIVQKYKGNKSETIAFNSLSDENDIYVGDIIIIPDGVMPVVKVQKQQTSANIPLAGSYFIVPVTSPYIITQRLHWYNAIDFSHAGNACGKSVLAAAGGTIQRTGYDKRAGNYIRILHPNGVVTFYGHLSKILVSPGQQVSQGSIIGYIGNTGHTIGITGCHVHFEVRGATNPFR